MEGYDETTYGERFADVYDEWYGAITDTEACVEAVAALAAGGAVLELGVGTGRLAIPLAGRGLAVTGLDSSSAMLDALAAKPDGDRVVAVLGSMADLPVDEPALAGPGFAAVLIAYNTLFNLTGPGEQERCLDRVARLLAPGGCVVVEAFVPDPDVGPGDAVTTRELTVDRVVLSVSRSRPGTQEVLGQYVDITEQGIRLRPWHIRWHTPDQLDAIAAEAGLVLAERWSGWDRAPFTPESPTHVSIYRSTSG